MSVCSVWVCGMCVYVELYIYVYGVCPCLWVYVSMWHSIAHVRVFALGK